MHSTLGANKHANEWKKIKDNFKQYAAPMIHDKISDLQDDYPHH